MWLALVLTTLALAEDNAPADVYAGRSFGIADLHIHQWDEYNFGGAWIYGHAEGPCEDALGMCDGTRGRGTVPLFGRHNMAGGVSFGLPPLLAASDDRNKHLGAGISTDWRVPHWAGWPTSDSIGHQQAWEGWLRLAHEGLPVAWYLQTKVYERGGGGAVTLRSEVRERWSKDPTLPDMAGAPDTERRQRWIELHAVQLAVRDFRAPAEYSPNMAQAAHAGFVGLNLAIVSMVNFQGLCDLMATQNYRHPNWVKGEPEVPARNDFQVCADMTDLRGQARIARAWAERNAEWVELSESPLQARNAIAAGKLAIIVSFEASDEFDDPTIAPATQLNDAYDQSSLRSLQLAHEMDNRFGGAAPVSTMLFGTFQRYFEEANAPDIPGEKAAGRCGRNELCPNTPDYARIRYERSVANSRRLFTGHNGPSDLRRTNGASLGRLLIRVLAFVDGGFDLVPAPPEILRDQGPTSFDVNRYGLTDDGRLILNAAVKLGMPVDLAHMSYRMMSDVLRELPRGYPAFISHSYPLKLEEEQHEDQVSDSVLVQLEARGGMFGLINREEGVAAEQREGTFGALESDYDCAGTSTTTLAFLDHVHRVAPTLGITFGTDLNGFINHTRGAGRLKPTVNAGVTKGLQRDHLLGPLPTPCGAIAPNIGSEIARRGVAHVGLLPQSLEEMRGWTAKADSLGATRFADSAKGTLERVQWSTDNWLALWEHSIAVGVTGESSKLDWAPPPPLPHPDFATLPEVPLSILPPGGGAEVVVHLPLLRAVEGVLPYITADGFLPSSTPISVFPQLHPTVAWQFGAEGYPPYDVERVPFTPKGTYACIGAVEAAARISAAVTPPGRWAGALNEEDDAIVTRAATHCPKLMVKCLKEDGCAGGPALRLDGEAPDAVTDTWLELRACVRGAASPE